MALIEGEKQREGCNHSCFCPEVAGPKEEIETLVLLLWSIWQSSDYSACRAAQPHGAQKRRESSAADWLPPALGARNGGSSGVWPFTLLEGPWAFLCLGFPICKRSF